MRRKQGFTITELMVAVVIMGVLATLAIPSFTSYIYKARVIRGLEFPRPDQATPGVVSERVRSVLRRQRGRLGHLQPDHDPGHRPDHVGHELDHRVGPAWSRAGRARSASRYAAVAGFPRGQPALEQHQPR